MLPIHRNWQPTTLNSIQFHYNTSNHLKINTIGPELPTTSTNRLQNVKSHLRDITECLHLPQIVPDFARIARNHRQTVSNCSESPLFTTHSTRINPNCLRIAPTRPQSSEFHSKLQQTALSRPTWS